MRRSPPATTCSPSSSSRPPSAKAWRSHEHAVLRQRLRPGHRGAERLLPRAVRLQSIPEIASPIFRGLDTGKSCIGFNAPEAYELLHLDEFADARGCKFLLNIDVDSKDEVERLVPIAVALGRGCSRRPARPITTGIRRCCWTGRQRVSHQPHALTCQPSGRPKMLKQMKRTLCAAVAFGLATTLASPRRRKG